MSCFLTSWPRAFLIVSLFSAVSTLFAEVLYEREPTENERTRYRLSGSINYPDKGRTYESVREEYRSIAWDKKTIKVELQKDPGEGNRPFVRIQRLGEDLLRKAAEKAWFENVKSNLIFGHDVAGYKYQGADGFVMKLADCPVVTDNLGNLGGVTQGFEGPKRESVRVYAYDFGTCTLDMHQFLRRFIRMESRLMKTEYGMVLVSEDKKKYRQNFSWLSGTNLMFDISIHAEESPPKDLREIYLKKNPSSLPAKLTIDKKEWGRAEMEFWLHKMDQYLKGEIGKEDPEDLEPPDYFGFFFAKMNDYAYVPFARDARMWRASAQEKRQMYDRLASWWAENKTKSYWKEDWTPSGCDEPYAILVAKGQAPEDVAKAERDKKAADLQARLNTPLTDGDREAARKALIEVFEKKKRDLIVFFRKQSETNIVARFDKIAEDEWVFEYPQGMAGKTYRTTERIHGPVLEKTDSKELPLMGVFCHERVEHGGAGEKLKFKTTFYYRKLSKVWCQ